MFFANHMSKYMILHNCLLPSRCYKILNARKLFNDNINWLSVPQSYTRQQDARLSHWLKLCKSENKLEKNNCCHNSPTVQWPVHQQSGLCQLCYGKSNFGCPGIYLPRLEWWVYVWMHCGATWCCMWIALKRSRYLAEIPCISCVWLISEVVSFT